jgi:hypothetical protein
MGYPTVLRVLEDYPMDWITYTDATPSFLKALAGSQASHIEHQRANAAAIAKARARQTPETEEGEETEKQIPAETIEEGLLSIADAMSGLFNRGLVAFTGSAVTASLAHPSGRIWSDDTVRLIPCEINDVDIIAPATPDVIQALRSAIASCPGSDFVVEKPTHHNNKNKNADVTRCSSDLFAGESLPNLAHSKFDPMDIPYCIHRPILSIKAYTRRHLSSFSYNVILVCDPRVKTLDDVCQWASDWYDLDVCANILSVSRVWCANMHGVFNKTANLRLRAYCSHSPEMVTGRVYTEGTPEHRTPMCDQCPGEALRRARKYHDRGFVVYYE